MDKLRLFDIDIDNVTMDEALTRVDGLVRERRNAYVVAANVDCVMKLQQDRDFMAIFHDAALVLADGMPLIWVSRLFKKPLKGRVTGADLFPAACRLAAEKGYRVFLLGADKGVAAEAARKLMQRYPGLDVCGTYSPSYGFEKNPEENARIVAMLREARPDMLFVGVGAPKQEKWIYRYRDEYDIPVSFSVGAAIDFAAGKVKRSPVWMQRVGLEWFYRFLKEPKRLFRRYFIEDTQFLTLTLREWRQQRNRHAARSTGH